MSKSAIFESYGWYRNMIGGWVHPHCLDYITWYQKLIIRRSQVSILCEYGSGSNKFRNSLSRLQKRFFTDQYS